MRGLEKQASAASSSPFEAQNERRQLREHAIVGTWQGAKAEEIEDYLLGT